MRRAFRFALWLCLCTAGQSGLLAQRGAQLSGLEPFHIDLDIDIEEAPFHYSETEGDNRVSRLIEKLKAKEIKLEYSREHGYLRSLLQASRFPSRRRRWFFPRRVSRFATSAAAILAPSISTTTPTWVGSTVVR